MLSEEKKESKVVEEEKKTIDTKPTDKAKTTDNAKTADKAKAPEDTKPTDKPKTPKDPKPTDKAKIAEDAISKTEAATKAVEEAEAAVKQALAKAKTAKIDAEAAAEEEYKAIAAEVKADAATKSEHTFKRQGEEIFRRDMGEPEFWLEKGDRFPRPILSADEQESLTRKAEIYQDRTPAYIPQHVLSPEFAGVSNYERGVDSFLEETKLKLAKLKNNPKATKKDIKAIKNKIIYLESLHENFYIGMNVFRTAKGGRDKVKA